MSSPLEGRLLTDVEELDALAPAWDELAVANRRPMAAPGWMLPMWRHLAPPQSQIRSVAVEAGGTLVGIAPLCVESGGRGRVDYRLLTHSTPRTEPLAVPGREWEVARVVGEVLATARPRPDAISLEAHAVTAHWPAALRQSWPASLRPVARQYLVMSSPTVSLHDDGFDAWLARRSANFRSQMRRAQRRFEAVGGRSRAATQATLRADVAAMLRLHEGRWEGRGRSSIVADAERFADAFEAVGRQLLDAGRFRLRVLEIDGRAISAQLFGAAGGEVFYYNGGWDEEFAELRPAQLALLHAIEEAFARGDRRMDLAPGAQPYKLRFADGDDPVAWTLLMLPGARLPLTVARSVPAMAWREGRDAAKRILPGERVEQLRAVRDRLRRD